MMERTPCVICYRVPSDANGLGPQPHYEGKKQEVTRFFNFLGRHVDEEDSKPDGKVIVGFGVTPFPIEKVIQAGILACADCSTIIDSFCELYHNMKSIELLLNWKVKTLKNIMLCAQRVPTRVREFRSSAEKLDIGGITADGIFEFKKELVNKCTLKLQRSLPKLVLNKYQPSQNALKSSIVSDGSQASPVNTSRCDCGSGGDDEPFDGTSVTDPVTPEPDNLAHDLHFAKLATEISPMRIENMGKIDDENLPGNALGTVHFPISHFVQVTVENDVLQLSPETTEIKPGSSEYDESEDYCEGSLDLDNNGTTNCKPATLKNLDPISESESNTKKHPGTALQPPPPMIIQSSSHKQVEKLQISFNSKTAKFECKICLRQFKSKQTCQIHYESRHLQIQFKCTLCAAIFPRRVHYYRHFKRAHTDSRVSSCTVCRKKFACETSLQRHHTYAHSKGRFQCPYCFKWFNSPNYRSRHIKRHCPKSNKIKSEQFTEVASSSATGNPLTQNKADTTEAEESPELMPALQCKKNLCYYCKGSFVHMSSLTAHQLICRKRPSKGSTSSTKSKSVGGGQISGTNAYRCSTCLKVFTQSHHLRRHFKTIHLQIREFPCDLCGGKFQRKEHLSKHRRRAHATLD